MCVCVCPPLDKGSSTTTLSTLHGQGRQARHIYLTQRSYDVSREVRADHSHVPAKFSTSCHPTFPRFDSWFFHDTFPTNRFPTAAFSRRRSAAFLQTSEQFVQQFSCADPFTLRFFAILPIGEIELTEYKLSKCVPLSRPTRVLSVIPVIGAPILHGKATTPTHHHSLDSHRKAPTPSPNQLTYRPPGQKTVLDEYIGFQLSDFGSVISFLQIMCVFPRFTILMP